MADLSLKIAVKLLTKNFHNGVNSLKSSIRSLQMQFFALSSALGAGTIGFTNLISRMRETAKETSAVKIALKNVSGSTSAFAENQKWLLSVADKYGVQINTLTSGFTKFKAAADIANMSAEDQRKIFESVSRASVAYALSAEDQRGVFMALSQMMSKGKVMAEELRLQMAERLPVAIQAMAEALGVSVGKMDAMMKQGKVLSSEVLPKFAEALTRMTPNIDLDNLNKSLSELSNSFVRLVEAFDIEGKYKAIVDTLGGALSWVADHADKVATAIRIAFEGLASFKLFKIFSGFAAEAEKEISGAQALISNYGKKVQALNEKRKVLAAARVEYVKAKEAEEALAAEASEERKIKAANRTTNAHRALTKKQNKFEQELSAAKAVRAKIDAETRAKAELASANMIQKGLYGIQVAAKRAGQFLKAAFSATLVTAFLTALYEVGRYLWKTIAEARRLKKLAEETRKALDAPLEISSQEQDLSSNLKILQNKKSLDNQRVGALQKINSLLGTEYKLSELTNEKMREINEKAARYVKYLQAQNRLEIAKQEHQKNKAEFDAVVQEYAPGLRERGVMKGKSDEAIATYIRNNPDVVKGGKGIVDALIVAENGLEHWSKVVSKYSTEFERSFDTSTSGGGGAGTPEVAGEETALQKAQKDYADALAELEAELGAQLITEREYTNKKRDLIEKSYINALSGGDADTLASPWFGNLQKEFSSFAHGQLRKRQEAVEDMLAEYHDNLQALNRQKENQVIAEEEYSDSVRQLAMSFAREAGALDLSDLPQQLVEAVAKEIKGAATKALQNTKPYQPIERDHRTWEMTESDVLAEELQAAEDYLAYLHEQAQLTGRDMVDEINAQLEKVDSLRDALKLADAKEAIEELSRELREGSWSGVRSAVSNLDGIVSAVERVNDVMEDTDASGWERLMAVWEAMASMVDGIMEMISVIETLQKVSDALTKAEMANSGKKVDANTAESASEAGKTAAKSPLPLGAKIAAIAGAVAAVIGIFASLPKFAKGGVVGGASTSGDKVLARLNSGEGVLTQRGMTNLAGLAESKASNVRVTGTLKARGRDLIVALDNEKRYQRRIK